MQLHCNLKNIRIKTWYIIFLYEIAAVGLIFSNNHDKLPSYYVQFFKVFSELNELNQKGLK